MFRLHTGWYRHLELIGGLPRRNLNDGSLSVPILHKELRVRKHAHGVGPVPKLSVD